MKHSRMLDRQLILYYIMCIPVIGHILPPPPVNSWFNLFCKYFLNSPLALVCTLYSVYETPSASTNPPTSPTTTSVTVRVVKPGHLKLLPCLTVSGNGNGGTLNLVEMMSTPSPQPVTTPTTPNLTPPGFVGGGGDEEPEPNQTIEDPDFDPDNAVIRGAPLEDDDEEAARTTTEGGDKDDGGGGDITTASTNGFASAPQQLAYSNVIHS